MCHIHSLHLSRQAFHQRFSESMLMRLINEIGMKKWSHIAQLLNGRIGKQCRARWHNHLNPDIKKDAWSEEEDKVLIQAHSEIGNKWAEIAKRLPGRTENSVKNHWNATKRRQFSRKTCQSPKYPKSGSLLQNYIKSVTIASTPPSVLTTEEQNSTCNEEWKGVVASSSTPSMNAIGNATTDIGHLSNTCLAPAYHFNDAPDLLLEEKSMHEMYDDAHLFYQLGCGYMASSSESSKDFEMAMARDAAIPPRTMPTTSSENVNGEMDLMEMIAQNNSLRSTF